MNPGVITFVTGTDTDVGKTVTTAALAATFAGSGATVAAYKPTQTGVGPGERADMAEVVRLSGISTVREGIRLRDPMAPVAAAVRAESPLPTLEQHMENIMTLAGEHSHVLVEGAGGLLVELDAQGHTLAELAVRVCSIATLQIVLVCRSGLGTLNHTQLTLEALQHRQLPPAGLVIGSWPSTPSYIEQSNLEYLQAVGTPFLGLLPEGAARLAPATFRQHAPTWFPCSPHQP